jgi:predicted ATPase
VPNPDVARGCRVGIASGPVIVGARIETGAAQERGDIGEPLDLASRLQTLAGADMVLIDGTTRRLVGDLFHCGELGRAGNDAPLAWKVLGPSAIESRFEALHAAALTPLVGREEEIDLLARCWAEASEGEGRVVLISGEPGIGKSRITLGLQNALQDDAHVRLRYFCSPHHASSALYPFVTQLERALRLDGDEAPTEKLARLRALLTEPAARIEHAVPILAGLLSLPADDQEALWEMTPEQRKERVFAILLAELQGLSAERPVLMIFEDVHWMDPTSRELLTLIVARIPTLPLLAIVTFRPEFAPPWADEAHVTAMQLGRLGPRQRTLLVERIAGDKGLSQLVVDEIAQRTDGVPLFLEELTKAVLETGGDETRVGQMISTAPPTAPAVPATLHASLMARLDRVGSAKEVAQTGAAIGREFSYELLLAISRHSEGELQSALARLTETGLLLARGGPPNATYQFKHALIQDAAYGMLLKGRRQTLHARIAVALETRFPALVQSQPEIVAHHYARAGLEANALDFLLQAGRLANDRSANEEAVTHLTAGLALLSSVQAEPDRNRLELMLLSALAPALTATKGYGAPETVAAYARARTLIWITQELSGQTGVLTGLYASYVSRAEYEEARDVAEESMQAAELRGDATDLCVAHRLVAVSYSIGGNFPAARSHADKAWACYDYERHGRLAWRHAQDIGVGAGSWLAIALSHLGRFAEAQRLTAEVLELAERVGHHNTMGYAHCCAAALPAFFSRDFATLGRHAAEMQRFGRQYNLPQWVSWGACLEAPALAAAGELARATDQMETGLQLRERINNRYATRLILTGAAEVHLRAGRADEALELVTGLLDAAPGTFERWTNAELLRLKGDAVLAAEGASADHEAEACYREAMATAQAQGSRTLLLRAATCLARLMAGRAQREEARALLGPVMGEESESPDWRDARALLDELQ